MNPLLLMWMLGAFKKKNKSDDETNNDINSPEYQPSNKAILIAIMAGIAIGLISVAIAGYLADIT